MTTVTIHILAELRGCPRRLLQFKDRMEKNLPKLVDQSGLTRLNHHFHQFRPFGVTGFFLLSESHISLHTWPEDNYIALDIFTCGEPARARKAFELFVNYFAPKQVEKKEVIRGVFHESDIPVNQVAIAEAKKSLPANR